MATYTHAYELDYTNLHEGDTVIIGGYNGIVERDYINFYMSHLGHNPCGAPMSATEAAIRAMKTGSSVSYSEKMMSAPVSEQKKSRIVFPKIR